MLKIIGPAAQLQHYTNVPMHDGYGPVTAFIHKSYVDYVPVDGRVNDGDSRLTRAKIIAAETGGEVHTRRRKDNYLVVMAKVPFTLAGSLKSPELEGDSE